MNKHIKKTRLRTIKTTKDFVLINMQLKKLLRRLKMETFDSNIALENCMFHGEIANKNADKRAIFLFLKNCFPKTYIPMQETIPANTLGNLTAKSFKPKINIERDERYTATGNLNSPKASKNNGKNLPHSSFPVCKIE